MAKNFYAVQVGKQPGVYTTWDECKKQVAEVKGAKYKGFDTEEAAWAFVEGVDENDEGIYDSKRDGVVAYVDGSYDEKTNRYSYGVVILNGERETHISGQDNDGEMAQMRNVAGEILGAKAAMQYAKDNGIKEMSIVHDYQGISAWAKGEWARNKKGTQDYRAFCEEIMLSVKITFKKAKGHSGNYFNDLADALAKRELGVKIRKSMEEHILEIENED